MISSSPAEPLFIQGPSTIEGRGLFAAREIPAGTSIVEYRGEKISKDESRRRCEAMNPYIFYLNAEFDLDGAVDWNPARLMNHSCDPNCEAELVDEGEIWIVAKRTISPGEELTFNYSYEPENLEDFPCRCGSPKCVGYMVAEEFFEMVRPGFRSNQ
jgi:hypothetical protein